MKKFVLIEWKKLSVVILTLGLAGTAYGLAPTSGLVAQWDAADAVFDGGGQLIIWPDANSNGHDLYPKYGTAGFDFRAYTHVFPGGAKPTVEFFGMGGLGMDDAVEDDFDLQNVSIFFVHGDRDSDGGIETGWLVWNFASGGYGTTIDASGIVPYAFNENQAPHPGPDGFHAAHAPIPFPDNNEWYTGTIELSHDLTLKKFHGENDNHDLEMGRFWDSAIRVGFYPNPDIFAIGSTHDGGVAHHGGIAEILIYDTTGLNEGQINVLGDQVEDYLYNKYWVWVPKCGDWGYLKADIDRNCVVEVADFAGFVHSWLGCTKPALAGCANLIDP